MNKYKLNTGQIIEGRVITIECIKVMHPGCPSHVMSRWGREYLNVFTRVLHGGYLLKIHCVKNHRHVVYWDWTDKRRSILSEWESKHKLWHDSCIEI